MPPAPVLVVGNPRGGTPLFLQHPTWAIDLPLKMLVWQDKTGEVYVTYDLAVFTMDMLARHGYDASNKKLIADANATEATLETVAEAAVGQPCCDPKPPGVLMIVMLLLSGRYARIWMLQSGH